jgi:hypothetical protein
MLAVCLAAEHFVLQSAKSLARISSDNIVVAISKNPSSARLVLDEEPER